MEKLGEKPLVVRQRIAREVILEDETDLAVLAQAIGKDAVNAALTEIKLQGPLHEIPRRDILTGEAE